MNLIPKPSPPPVLDHLRQGSVGNETRLIIVYMYICMYRE